MSSDSCCNSRRVTKLTRTGKVEPEGEPKGEPKKDVPRYVPSILEKDEKKTGAKLPGAVKVLPTAVPAKPEPAAAKREGDVATAEEDLGTQAGKRAITMKILTAVIVSAVVMGIVVSLVTAVAMNYDVISEVKDVVNKAKDYAEEAIPKVGDSTNKMMADLWASKSDNYLANFFKWKRTKNYEVEIPAEGNYFMDLFVGKKNKRFNVKITG